MDTSLIMKERELLKSELQSLKDCQVKYFSFTITGTGIIFGVAEKFGEGKANGLIYLIPLLLIIPLWSIFFDKASSITRIVGYMRVIEGMLVGEPNLQYVGWEKALRKFRERDAQLQPKLFSDYWIMVRNAFRAVALLFDFRRQHRYWIINWLTFFGLGVCALYLAKVRGTDPMLWTGAAVFFAFACLHNADVLWSLVKGKFQWNAREELWTQILTVKPAATAVGTTTPVSS